MVEIHVAIVARKATIAADVLTSMRTGRRFGLMFAGRVHAPTAPHQPERKNMNPSKPLSPTTLAVAFVVRSIISFVIIYFLGKWMGGEWWQYILSFFIVGSVNLWITNWARRGM